MSEMSQFLAEYYGNASAQPAPSGEDLEKQAQVELFTKLAADNNIDIQSLPDQQVEALWGQFQAEYQKLAQEQPKDPDGDGDDHGKQVVEEAKKEHEEKKAAAEKVAEADFLGRVMAHAYVQELRSIGTSKEASAQPASQPAVPAQQPKTASVVKRASALDQVAAEHAVKIAAANGWDGEEAAQRVTAVLILGPQESMKTASAGSFEGALDIRALELLEAAGYPVTWNE